MTMQSMLKIYALSMLLVGCSDDHVVRDLGPAFDLTQPDLPVSLPDLGTCPLTVFPGFSGNSPSERRG